MTDNYVSIYPKKEEEKKASERFVRRNNVMEQYHDNFKNRYDIVAYYGYAGIGKSSLEELLLEELEEKSSNHYFVLYNFYEQEPTSFVDFMYGLRYRIEKKYPELSFPYFDILSTIYLEKNQNYNPVLNKDEKPGNNDELKASNMIISILKKAIKYMKLVPNDYTKMVLEKAEKGINIYEEFGSFSKIAQKIMDCCWADENLEKFKKETAGKKSKDIERTFPIAFIKDLNENTLQDDESITIMLDTLDYCSKDGLKSIEKEINQSLLNCEITNIKWIITNREKVKDYENNQRIKLVQLSGLNEEEAFEFLKKNGVEEEDIIRQMIQITDGCPLYLELCVDIYRSIDNPTVNDFTKERFSKMAEGGNLSDYLDKLFLYLSDKQKSILRAFSFLRKWDEKDLIEICSESNFVTIETGSDEYNQLLRSSMITRQNDVFEIQRAIAEIVYADENFEDERKEQLERAFLNLLKERIQNGQAKDYYYDSFLSHVENYHMHLNNEILILEVSDLVRKYYYENNFHSMIYLDKELYLLAKQNQFSKKARIRYINNYIESSNKYREVVGSVFDKKEYDEAKERLEELMSINEQILDGKNPLPDSIVKIGIEDINETIEDNNLLDNEVNIFINNLNDKTNAAIALVQNDDYENAALIQKEVVKQIEVNERKIRDFYDHEELITNWISEKYLLLCSFQMSNLNFDDALETYEKFRRLTPSERDSIWNSLGMLGQLYNVDLLEAYQMRKDDYRKKAEETGMPKLIAIRKAYCDYLKYCNQLFGMNGTDAENDFRNIEWLFLDLEKESDELAALMFSDSVVETWSRYMENETIPILETIYAGYLNCIDQASLVSLHKPFANWEEYDNNKIEEKEMRAQHIQRIDEKLKRFVETTKQLYNYDLEAE